MTSVIQLGQSDTDHTPLYLLDTQTYEPWKKKQPPHVQRWLEQTQFDGKGVQPLPDEQGNMAAALCVVDSFDDTFAAGDLAQALPHGSYVIANQPDDNTLISVAFAWGAGAYRFERFVKQDTPQARLVLTNEHVFEHVQILLGGTSWTRDLINSPANAMMPEDLASAAGVLAEEFGGHASSIVGEALLDKNYPMIHAVGRASQHPPRLIELTWGDTHAPKLTLIGKGICFDSGGLDIKPSSGMRLMKKDMGGAAHVIGLAYMIMRQKLPVRLKVLIPAAENAVAGNAFRPGDVLPTRKGLSVEIDNTDAEGRLVLCDAIDAAIQDKPDLMLDFATLTGACRVALGTEVAGFFTNSQNDLANALIQKGHEHDDHVWALPLHSPYKAHLKSDIADLSNCSNTPFGGAITAALFLNEFVDDTEWAHFDLMAWNNRHRPGRPQGGEAMGIRAVFAYLKERYGKS